MAYGNRANSLSKQSKREDAAKALGSACANIPIRDLAVKSWKP